MFSCATVRLERQSALGSSAGKQANADLADEAGVALSADGRFVALDSAASNLVAGDRNSAADVFVHDRRTGKTERVSLSSRGGEVEDGSGDFRLFDERRRAFRRLRVKRAERGAS